MNYGGDASDDGLDFYSDNPLYADPLFTPASTGMRSGMRSNSAFEETQAADLAIFTGGSAYGAAGFGVRAAPPHSSSRQQQPGGFDPDPRLFGSAADASEAAVLRDEVQAIVLAGDALQPPTSTSSTLLQSPAGALRTLQVNDPWQSSSSACFVASSLPSPTPAHPLQVDIQGTTRGRAYQRTSRSQMCWAPSCAIRSVCMLSSHRCSDIHGSTGHGPRQSAAEYHRSSKELLLALPQIGAPDAVRQYAAICRARAGELRATAAGQLQRAARYLALRDEVRRKQSSPLARVADAVVCTLCTMATCRRSLCHGLFCGDCL